MKQRFLLSTFIVILLLVGCKDEEFITNTPSQNKGYVRGNTFTFEALMPGEATESAALDTAKTKVSLVQDDLNILLSWQERDSIEFCVVYGVEESRKTARGKVPVENISTDGKSANFTIHLPNDITDTFSLYGVHGGGGLDIDSPTELILPDITNTTAGSLLDLGNNKTVVLLFEKKDINFSNPGADLSVNFKHLGSIFNIRLTNRSTKTWGNIKRIELKSATDQTIGAHISHGEGRYNVTTKTFTNSIFKTELPFTVSTSVNVSPGEDVVFWGWFTPDAEAVWPEMTLSVFDELDTELSSTSNSMPKRKEPTKPGAAFYLLASWDGTELNFTTPSDNIIYVAPNGTGWGTSWSDAMGDIQEAIDKASSGDEVWIQGGSYNLSSPIVAKANVNIYGSFEGSEVNVHHRPIITDGNSWDFVSPTVLDGQNQTRVLEIRVASTVDGLTIINGNGASTYQNGRGGGVDIVNDDAIIQNSIIRDNSSTSNGGGMHILRGVIRRCLIENNSTPSENTSARGGGIYVNSYHKVLIEENTIRGNFSYQGGGIRAQHPATTEIGTVILKNRIYNNTSSHAGAALSLTAAKNELINNLVYNNEGPSNQPATVIAGGKVINNSFVNNIGHVLFSISTNPYEFISNIDYRNSARITGASNNENLLFHNNLSTDLTYGNSWDFMGNVEISLYEVVFKEATSFIGAATDAVQRKELEETDFSLIASSSALNTGKTVLEVTDDIIGTSRPQGDTYDIGAYELVRGAIDDESDDAVNPGEYIYNNYEWVNRVIPDHPRMFFNEKTFPDVKSRTLNQERDLFQIVKTRTDRLLGQTIEFSTPLSPSSSDDQLARNAAEAALVYWVTNDLQYLELSKNLLIKVSEYYELRNSNQLPVSWYAFSRLHALMAYDWIYNDLTEEARTGIGTKLFEELAYMLPSANRANFPGENRSSAHNTGFYGNQALEWYMGLVFYQTGISTDIDRKAEELLKKGFDDHVKVIEFRESASGDDGGAGNATLAYSLADNPWAEYNFFLSFLSATGGYDITTQYNYLANWPNYLLWNVLPKMRHFGFGDDRHTENSIAYPIVNMHLSHFLHFYGDKFPQQASMAKWLMNERFTRVKNEPSSFPLSRLFITNRHESISPVDFSSRLPLARYFEGMGQVFMRSGSGVNDTYATFTVSGNHIHKHFDNNNFMIYKKGFLTIDSGTRPDGNHLSHYYSRTVAHNCITIRMPGEVMPHYWGSKAPHEASEPFPNDGGQARATGADVVAFDETEHYVYIASDATGSYNSAKTNQVLRQFVFLPPNNFVVFDRVNATNKSYPKKWLLHTAHKPELISNNEFYNVHEEGSLICKTIFPEDAKTELIGGSGKQFWSDGKNWPLPYGGDEHPLYGQWRVEISPRSENNDDIFLHLIQVGDASANIKSIPSAEKIEEPSMKGVQFSYEGKEYEILFNTAGTAGGKISITENGNAIVNENFTNTVKQQSELALK